MTLFRRLILVTILTSYALIVIGGIVRVTGAGMGCGDDWPVCNGEVVPVFSLLTALEYTHRVVAALVSLLSAGLVVAGWRVAQRNRLFLILPIIALVLVLLQAGLGAITVFLELHAPTVTAHLGMAATYLATLIALALLAFDLQPLRALRSRSADLRPRAAGRFGALALGTALAVLVLMLTGAYTATSGAGYACREWPLCEGRYLPTGWTVIDVHLTHRWVALIATVAVVATAYQARKVRSDVRAIVALTSLAVALMAGEILLGAANIWFKLAPAVSATHLAVATAIWALQIAVFGLDRLLPLQSGAGRMSLASAPERDRPASVATG